MRSLHVMPHYLTPEFEPNTYATFPTLFAVSCAHPAAHCARKPLIPLFLSGLWFRVVAREGFGAPKVAIISFSRV